MVKTKTMKIIEMDGKIFSRKADLNFYIKLKEHQNQGYISYFEFEQNEEGQYISEKVEVDGLFFSYNKDLEYYIQLKKTQQEGWIESFELKFQETKGAKTKYQAKKVMIDNHVFDSKIEADYYIVLIKKKRNGEILDFGLKPTFELQSSFKKYGKTIHKIEYIADFDVTTLDGSYQVVDVKGMITPDFAIKAKLFDYKYPDIQLILMKYVEKFGGWIEQGDWKKEKREEKKQKMKGG